MLRDPFAEDDYPYMYMDIYTYRPYRYNINIYIVMPLASFCQSLMADTTCWRHFHPASVLGVGPQQGRGCPFWYTDWL